MLQQKKWMLWILTGILALSLVITGVLILPKQTAAADEEKLIRCGGEYPTDLPAGEYRVYGESGEFLMLGRSENGSMWTVKNFFEV